MNCVATLNTNPNTLGQLFKAAGDELRLSILQILAKDSYGVLELVRILDVKQSGMSHHLKVLANAGLVVTRREGNSIFYRRATLSPDDPLHKCKHAIFDEVDVLETTPCIRTELEKVWLNRAETSQRFFLEHATAFKQQQDLIASFDVYRAQVTEMLNISQYDPSDSAIEIGPGEGDFLHELSQRFSKVFALDNSLEMLDLAKQRAEKQSLQNIHFIQGDTRLLEAYPERFGCAVINMVLHHTPSPAQVFKDVGYALKSNGTLIITELCPHNQNWAQETCGDLWLGLAPEDLKGWADNTGFTEGQSTYFALRNGFQIQVRQFIKH